MTPVVRSRALACAIGCVISLSSCATTIDDDSGTDQTLPAGAVPADDATGQIEGGVIVDSVPDTTMPVTGSATELLPELATEMSRLGSQIADGEGDNETLVRIEAIWDAIRPEIESTRPELLNGIGATVDMARVAVERTRPADADKAFSVLTDLVDKFTGDG